jgi:hypothetical protein
MFTGAVVFVQPTAYKSAEKYLALEYIIVISGSNIYRYHWKTQHAAPKRNRISKSLTTRTNEKALMLTAKRRLVSMCRGIFDHVKVYSAIWHTYTVPEDNWGTY